MVRAELLPPRPQLPEFVPAVGYHRDPLGVLRRLQARYWPVFTVRFPLKDPLVFLADPQALTTVLGADPDRARAGAGRRAILPQASPASPVGADGAAHAETRARMWAAFSPEGLSEATFAQLRDRLDERQEMLAMKLNSLGVQPDPPRTADLPPATRLRQRLAGR